MLFEIFLFSVTLLCVLVILVCKFVFPGISKQDPEPWYLDFARSFFPVLLIVFALRAFVIEPFRIPSQSMLPTLQVGDFLLVNKYRYGLRLPIIHTKILDVGNPERGDIMVFRYPPDDSINFIKRVIGLPGDTIEYKRNKRLYVNGELVEGIPEGDYTPFRMPNRGPVNAHDRFRMTANNSNVDDENQETEYSILLNPMRGSKTYRKIVVPQGHYFMMGDNRDNSADSRVWGFVPSENIVGEAVSIWFHYNTNPNGGFDFSRIGEDI